MNRDVFLALVAVVLIGGAVVLRMPRKTPPTAAPVAADPATGDTRYPVYRFEAQTTPPASDYATALSWAALPHKVDFADRVPADHGFPDAQARTEVDVLYIQPTTLRTRKGWLQDVSEAASNRWTASRRSVQAMTNASLTLRPKIVRAAAGAP